MSFTFNLTHRRINKQADKKSLYNFFITLSGTHYKRGDLIDQHALEDSILFLEKGKVSIVNQEHQEVYYQEQFIEADNFINLETAFNKNAYQGCSLQVEASSTIKKISFDRFNNLLNNPSFNQIILQSLANQTRRNQKKANRLRFMSSKSRVLQYLWDLANEKGKRIGYEVVIDFPPTQLEISIAAGTARQTATTNLLELRKINIIHYTRRSLIFRDIDKLKQLLDESR